MSVANVCEAFTCLAIENAIDREILHGENPKLCTKPPIDLPITPDIMWQDEQSTHHFFFITKSTAARNVDHKFHRQEAESILVTTLCRNRDIPIRTYGIIFNVTTKLDLVRVLASTFDRFVDVGALKYGVLLYKLLEKYGSDSATKGSKQRALNFLRNKRSQTFDRFLHLFTNDLIAELSHPSDPIFLAYSKALMNVYNRKLPSQPRIPSSIQFEGTGLRRGMTELIAVGNRELNLICKAFDPNTKKWNYPKSSEMPNILRLGLVKLSLGGVINFSPEIEWVMENLGVQGVESILKGTTSETIEKIRDIATRDLRTAYTYRNFKPAFSFITHQFSEIHQNRLSPQQINFDSPLKVAQNIKGAVATISPLVSRKNGVEILIYERSGYSRTAGKGHIVNECRRAAHWLRILCKKEKTFIQRKNAKFILIFDGDPSYEDLHNLLRSGWDEIVFPTFENLMELVRKI